MGIFRLSSDFYVRWPSAGEGIDDESLLFALRLIRDAGYERAVFYERDEAFTPGAWLKWTRAADKLFFLLYRSDGTQISAVWFDGFSATGRQAYSHFCTFKTGRYDEFAECGRRLLAFVGQSTPIMQAVGITPACYRHALKLAYDLGYVRTALLKKAVLVHGKERDAVLTVNDLQEAVMGGGGGKGGGSAPTVKPAPVAPAVVAPMDAEPSSQAASEQERKRRQAASGRSDTILTRGLMGARDETRTGGKKLSGE